MSSQWPPRSPHEVLLSTPGGRARLQRMAERTSPSPSPSKLRIARARAGLCSDQDDQDEDGDEDGDEDEEILKLQLQALEAKLKLKKLQRKKAAAAGTSSDTESTHGPARRRPQSAAAGTGVPLQSRLAAARDKMDREQEEAKARSASASAVQVPASPVRKARTAGQDVTTSPQRVVLGIDKGLRAADVSLKRAPSFRKTADEGAGYLRRARTPNLSQAQKNDAAPRGMSFNERLASAREEEAARLERQERIRSVRSTAFGLRQDEMEKFKASAVEIPDEPLKAEEFSRDEILATVGRTTGARSDITLSARSPSRTGPSRTEEEEDGSSAQPGAYEPYTGFHLSRRFLPHAVLTRTLASKTTYHIKDLLVQVKAPEWTLPDVETDIVVFAIIAGKSEPRHHAPKPSGAGKPPTERGKYLVMTLVDLEYEIELFLFDTGFTRFWKLTPGTVVAILNPGIIKPPAGKEATGKFSLVINSDADMVLEIGNARDLGFCKSVRKDGALCKTWVNKKRTEYCEFHTNEAVTKMRSGRMELNSDSFGGGAGGGKGPRNKWLNSRKKEQEEEEMKKLGSYDRETRSQFFVSSAALIDGENGIADRVEREEGLKRRLAQKERERDIAKKLGEVGGGAGKEYMSRAAAAVSSQSSSSTLTATLSSRNMSLSTTSTLPGDRPVRPDARALGLVVPKGQQPKVDLSRAKRKRPDSALSGASSSTAPGDLSGRAAMGWGTALSSKLARMKEGEKLDGTNVHGGDIKQAFANIAARRTSPERQRSPVRKKTRFVTEKGIREAGRESLGEPLSVAAKLNRQVVLDDDDDDDLVIVK